MKDIAITSLETIMAFDIVTGKYLFTLDELQNAKISNTQDSLDITGKGGRKLNSIKRNKAVTISGSNGLISGGLLALQTGGTYEQKTAKVKVPDFLVINSNKATTTFKAVGTTGNEIDSIYIKNSDGSLGKTLEQDAAAASGKFTYDPATKVLEFNASDYPDGTEIVAYYFREVDANVLENISDQFSKKCELYIDAFGEDVCANIYRIQFYIPKADFNGNFDFEMGDNQSVHAFEAESLSGACGGAGQLWTYTIFGADTQDA